jgi:hypothetical protein
MGFQIQHVGVRQQSRQPFDDGFAVFFTDTDINSHAYPLAVVEFIQQVFGKTGFDFQLGQSLVGGVGER